MPLHLVDNACLTPRLTTDRPGGPHGSTERRVLGLLHRPGNGVRPLLVDTIHFDGARCRYRTIEPRCADVSDGPWLDEQDGDEYHPCASLVIERLYRLLRESPGLRAGPAVALADTVMDAAGHARLALREPGRRRLRWIDA